MAGYEIINLSAGDTLTLTTDISDSGYYQLYPIQLEDQIIIGVSSTVLVGPFTIHRQYRIVSEVGLIATTVSTVSDTLIVGSTPTLEINIDGDIGFFGATPAPQQPNPGPLTNDMGSTTTDGTLESVIGPGGKANGPACERNFSELDEKMDDIRDVLQTYGLTD